MARKISKNYKSDYGYSYTDAAIFYLLNHSRTYLCDYFVFTNGDNLYAGGFVDFIADDMKNEFDIIGFNFISHYVRYKPMNRGSEDLDDGTMHVVDSEFEYANIDLGAFVIRAELLDLHKNLRFVAISRISKWDVKGADGYLIAKSSNLAKTSRMHRQVLLIHQ